MKLNLKQYGQYKNDIFTKLNYSFTPGKKILDVGCGDGSDVEIFIKEYKLKTHGIDVYEHKNIRKIKGLIYKKSGIYNIPYPDTSFDYVFLHDVLHHIDEPLQRREKHIEALIELKRVCKKGGTILIVEGNRYNPLFYPHMVKVLGHNHFKQSYFKNIVTNVFTDANIKHFEAHLYPARLLTVFKIYERLMEKCCPKYLLAYNVALITKNG